MSDDICDLEAHRVHARVTLGRLVVTCETCGKISNHDIPKVWLNESIERETNQRSMDHRNRIMLVLGSIMAWIGFVLIAWAWWF